MGRGGHGDRGRGDVLGLHAIPNQLGEVRRVHVLVVVPAEPVEGDHQQLVVGLHPARRGAPATMAAVAISSSRWDSMSLCGDPEPAVQGMDLGNRLLNGYIQGRDLGQEVDICFYRAVIRKV